MAEFCCLEEIRLICARAKGIEFATCDQDTAQEITRQAYPILQSTFPLPWQNPSKIESEVGAILGDIRKLRRRIVALDGYTKSLARQHAERDEEKDILEEIIAAADDPVKMAEAEKRFDEFSRRPKESWVDIAALAHLDALEKALVRPVEVAIEASPPGAGRRPNRRAYRVAFAAARAFRNLTDSPPTFWNGGATPFSRMVADIYSCAGIKADLRKPIEAAMRKLESDG